MEILYALKYLKEFFYVSLTIYINTKSLSLRPQNFYKYSFIKSQNSFIMWNKLYVNSSIIRAHDYYINIYVKVSRSNLINKCEIILYQIKGHTWIPNSIIRV